MKLSIRFYNDREVRAVWDDEYLKAKLKKEGNELVSATTQLKLKAADGKKYNTDVLDAEGVSILAKSMPNQKATAFLDLMLKARLGKCVDWSRIAKSEYLQAMTESVADSTHIKGLLANALTDDIHSREMFMKGIDYSYYYEQEDNV